MGYTTDFTGSFTLSRPATSIEMNYINTFSSTRRMKRDVKKLMKVYKGKFGLPLSQQPVKPEVQKHLDALVKLGYNPTIDLLTDTRTPEEIYGKDGEYFAHDDGNSGQKDDGTIIDQNTPPGQHPYGVVDYIDKNEDLIERGLCQPTLWCQWELNEYKNKLRWDGGEKFYRYVEWLKYMITHFFEPWGIKLNGEVTWDGEDSGDIGKIIVKDNKVTIKEGSVVY